MKKVSQIAVVIVFLAGGLMSGWLSGCCDSSGEPWSLVDLTISDVVASPTSVNPGDSILVIFRVNNAGSRLARSSTADLYLSGDTTIDISDVKVGSCRVSQIEEKTFLDIRCPATISADQAPGSYYLGVIADAANVIDEIYDPAGFEVTNIVTSVSAGANHTCILLSSGSIMCWGWNRFGQLGDGTTIDSNVPVFVSGITTAIAISAGSYHTCALLSSGSIMCWGHNLFNQLGNGTTTHSNVPVLVSGITSAIAVSAGLHGTYALLPNGSIMYWGRTSMIPATWTSPVFVSGITDAMVVSAGDYHQCAVLSSGSIMCWGNNWAGQLGDGTTATSNVPVVVSGITIASSVAASGYYHTCGLLSSGSIMCWGYNEYGQLGNGTWTNSSIPAFVSGITDAIEVSAAAVHTCALLSSGSIMCWGDDSNIPDFVSGITTASSVSAGDYHNCALLSSGSIMCWGRNSYGQLGDGTTTDSNVPVQVIGLP